ncbi:MAG: TIGR03086 family metal-binding protein [Acidimicrobiales bacterium]
MNPDPIDQLATALACTGTVIDAISADQWRSPTLCTDWNVTELVEHLATGNAGFEAALRHQDPTPPATDGRADTDPAIRYRQSIAGLVDAFSAPGVMDRLMTVPFGTVPGAVAANLRLTEVLVHGWDLAQATGHPISAFPEYLAEAALAFTRGSLGAIPPGRSPFAPPQPVADDAPAIDRLAACLGRPVPSPIRAPAS